MLMQTIICSPIIKTHYIVSFKKEILSTSREVNMQFRRKITVVFFIQAILAAGTKVSSVFNLMASQHPARPPPAPTTARTWAGTDPTRRHKTQRPMTAQHDPECLQEIPVMPQKAQLPQPPSAPAHGYIHKYAHTYIHTCIYTTDLITF